tara:strand:- start:161 stop:349 length:189 start_codon:yes stop_codon:yes gene_type:complete
MSDTYNGYDKKEVDEWLDRSLGTLSSLYGMSEIFNLPHLRSAVNMLEDVFLKEKSRINNDTK